MAAIYDIESGECGECGEATSPLYYSCCGDPVDGSAGTGCDHDGGTPTCGPCGAANGWWDDDEAADQAEAD